MAAANKPYRGGGTAFTHAKATQIARKARVKPLEPYRNARDTWKCECLDCGKTVFPRLKAMQNGKRGCFDCAVKANQSNLKVKSEKAAEGIMLLKIMGFVANVEYPGNRTGWEITHKNCGKVITPTLLSLKRAYSIGESGCMYCSGHKVDVQDAINLMIEANLSPLVDFPGSNLHWTCRCNLCSRIVNPSYSTVKKGHKGCKWCSGVIIDPTEAHNLMVGFGFEPLVKYPGSEKPWRSLHVLCGHEVSPSLGKLKAGEGGCKFCRTGGFDAGAPARLYLITNPRLKAAKIGITKDADSRLVQHKAEGWVINFTQTCRGDVALMAEDFVLSRWRGELGLKPFLMKTQMPQGGYTETAELKKLDIQLEWKGIKKFLKTIPEESLPALEPRNRKVEKVKRDWRAERLLVALEDMKAAGFKPIADYPGVSEPWASKCLTCHSIVSPRLTNVRKGHGCNACRTLKK